MDAVNIGPTFGVQHWRRQRELKIGVCATITKPRVHKDLSNHFTLLSDLLHGIRQSGILVMDSFNSLFRYIVTTKGFICCSEVTLVRPHIF